jgi:hypothetical protein
MALSDTKPRDTSPNGLPENLYRGVLEIVSSPLRTLIPPWSWKAALLSALFRAGAFFSSNLKSGPHQAVRAMLIEAVYAVITAGLIGAVSQRLRAARPVWATAGLVCLALPGLMILAQFGVHRLAHTPHVGAGLVVSFCGSALAAAFSLFAMRRGYLLGGDTSTSIRHDLEALPRITVEFVSALPRTFLGS